MLDLILYRDRKISLMTKETFFIQVPPGLEELAKREFLLKFVALSPGSTLPEPVIEAGGLSIQLPMDVGVKLNYWLKLPNRILLRLAHFKCRDLPKLFNKVSKLPLGDYFAGQDFQFHISSNQSRLFDSRRIEKTLKDALEQNLKRQEPKKKAKDRVLQWEGWRFYCRFQDDWCDLSLDTSGERLGKRGSKTKVGMAPLRENLASALYFSSLQQLDAMTVDQIYQGEKEVLLVDPFAGSGTLLSESALFFRPNLERDFSFSYLPLFLGKEASIAPPRDPQLHGHTTMIAGELSEQQFQALEENLNAVDRENTHLVLGDSFNGNLKKVIAELNPTGEVAFCMTNPPYGKRVQTDQRLKIADLLNQIFELHPFELVGILMPKEFPLPQNKYQLISKLHFSHGGTPVTYSMWKKKDPSL